MLVTRREQNKINSRKRILKASRKLFASKGYENAMIEDIANKAEVSKATLYNYFPNKESLLIGTEQELIDKIIHVVDTKSGKSHNGIDSPNEINSPNESDSPNSIELIKWALEELVCEASDYYDISRKINYLNSCKDSVLYDGRREIEDMFKDLVIKAQNEKLIRPDAPPDEVADTIMGIYLTSLFQWNRDEQLNKAQLKDKLDNYFDTIIKVYLA